MFPQDIKIENDLNGEFDFIQYFVIKKEDLAKDTPKIKRFLKPDGLLWVSYPKGNALNTDLNRDILFSQMQKMGLQAVAQISIDDIWSAMWFKLLKP